MYIDGFLIPVPTANKEIYRAHETTWWPAFRAKGAQSLVIGWADDVAPGTQTDFLRAVDLRADETVVFAWMIWPDKATRDACYAAMMADPEMSTMEFPFDGKRLVYGGFQPIVVES